MTHFPSNIHIMLNSSPRRPSWSLVFDHDRVTGFNSSFTPDKKRTEKKLKTATISQEEATVTVFSRSQLFIGIK